MVRPIRTTYEDEIYYSGEITKQKIIPKSLGLFINKLVPLEITRQRNITDIRQKIGIGFIPIYGQNYKQIEIQKPKQIQRTLTLEKQKQMQRVIQIQPQKQMQRITPISKQRYPELMIYRFRPPPIIVTPPPTKIGQIYPSSFSSKGMTAIYDVFTRKGGKEIKIAGGLTRGAGIQFGAGEISKTLRASFRLQPAGFAQVEETTIPILSDMFYSKSGKGGETRYIEKRRFRLNQPMEVSEIQASKKKINRIFGF